MGMEESNNGLFFYKILNDSLADYSGKMHLGLNDFGLDKCSLYYKENVMAQPIVPPHPVIAKFFIDKKYLGKKNYQKIDAGYVLAAKAELLEYHSFSEPETIDWLIDEKVYMASAATAFDKYIRNSDIEKFVIPRIRIEITKDVVLTLIRYEKENAVSHLLKNRRNDLARYKEEMFDEAIKCRNKNILSMILDEWDLSFVISKEKIDEMKITNQNIIDLLNENGFDVEVYDHFAH